MNIPQLGKSFQHALRGLRFVLKNEQNFRLQMSLAVVTIAVMIYFPLATWERVLLIILVMMVLTMELLNTALEYFADLLKPRLNDYVGNVKDIMAGAVFVTAVGSAVIGLLILWPHFLTFAK